MGLQSVVLRLLLAGCGWIALTGVLRAESIPIAAVTRTEPVEFDRDILPLLRKNCLACHSAREKQGGLVLETAPQAIKGGDNGAAVVAGKSAESLLLRVAAHQTDPIMPPAKNDVAAKPLTSDELGLLRLWIDQGAKAGSGSPTGPRTLRPIPSGVHPIQAVALTADGQLAAAARGNQIVLYHPQSGQLLTRLIDPALVSGPTAPQIAHRDLIQSLAVNAEGDRLASGAYREVKLWRRPRDVRTLTVAAAAELTTVAVSPDGTTIATGRADGAIALWDAAGKPVRELTGHTGPVSGLRFRPDGKELVSVSQDKSLRLWNVATGAETHRFELVQPIQAVEWVRSAVSPPGPGQAADYLAVACAGEPFLRLFRASPLPSPAPTWTDLPPQPTASAASLDQKVVVVAAKDGTLQARDSAAGTLLETWKRTGPPATAVTVGPGSAMPPAIVCGDEQGQIHLRRVGPGQPPTELVFGGAASRIAALAMSPDGQRVISGGADGTLTLWNSEPLPPRDPAPLGPDRITAFALDPNGGRIATASVIQGVPTIVIRKTENGEVAATLTGHQGAIHSVAFSPDGTKLVSGSADQTARAWSLSEAPKELSQFAEHMGEVRAVAFSGDGTQVLSGAENGTVRLWTVADGKLVADCPGHTGPVVAALFAAGNQPVTASADQSVRFWNGTNGQQVRAVTESQPVTAMTCTRDGQRLAVALKEGQVVLRNLDGNQTHLLTGHTAAARAMQPGTDGARLVSLDGSGRVLVWDLMNGRLIETAAWEGAQVALLSNAPGTLFLAAADGMLRQTPLRFVSGISTGTAPITAVAYRPDGQMLFAASNDGLFRGYGPATLNQPVFQQNHGAAIHALAVSPDNQHLATAGEDRQIRLWNTAGGGANPGQLAGFAGPVRSVLFSTDSQRVLGAAAGPTPQVLVFQRQDGSLDQAFPRVAGTTEMLLPTTVADRFLTVSPEAGLGLLEVTALRKIPGSGGAIHAIIAAPDLPGQFFSGSDDGTVRRWNADNGGQLAQYNHGGGVKAIAVSPDGKRVAAASDNHVIKLWNMNGQQQPEMRGDLRTRLAASRRQQQHQSALARRDTLKQLLAQAEQDVPNKTNAAKTAADALAAANKGVEEKQAAVKQTLEAKTAAEKSAIEQAAAAQKAVQARVDAETVALAMANTAKGANDRATRLAQLAQANPDDTTRKQAAEAAQQGAQTASAASQQATAAVAGPTQAAQQAMTAANEAAQKAVAAQKPWSDAVAALKTAEGQQNLAAQQSAVATREQEAATKFVPVAKGNADAAEAAVQEAQRASEAANQLAGQADQAVRALAFSADGRVLISAGDYAAIQGWDGETGASLSSYEGHQGAVRGLAFASDGRLVSVSADKTLGGWELHPGWTLERTIGNGIDPAPFAHRVLALDFRDDGEWLACGGGEPSRTGEIQIFRMADGAPVLAIPEPHSDTVLSLQFSADGQRLASGGADRTLRTFDLAAGGKLIRRFEGHTHHVLGVAWKTDGSLLTTASADGTLKTWNADTGDQVVTMMPNSKLFTAVRYIGDTNNVVATNTDGLPRMYRANDGGLFLNLNPVSDYLHSVDVTPNQQTVIAGGHRGTLYIWNGQNGQLLHRLDPAAAR